MITNSRIFNYFINCYKDEMFHIIHVVKTDIDVDDDTYYSMYSDELYEFFKDVKYETIENFGDYIKIIINNTNYYILGV